jgi:hypothetical protein
MQGRLTTRPRDSLARSVDKWLVVKVGDGPRLVAAATHPHRAASPEHITGRAKRTPARGARTLAWAVPVGGSAYGTSAHQRKAVCVKHLVGAASVVCPCIAVNRAVPGSV